MLPTHHVPVELLYEAAVGVLDPVASLVVQLHLQRCPLCRKEMQTLEELGGAFLERAPVEAMAMAPSDLTDLVATPPDGSPVAPVRTRLWAGLGLKVYRINQPVAGDWRAFDIEAPAGFRAPPHHHRGRELTCVLTGGLSDGDQVFEAGDFMTSGSDGAHRVSVLPGAPCRIVIAIEGGFTLTRPRQWAQQLS